MEFYYVVDEPELKLLLKYDVYQREVVKEYSVDFALERDP